MNEERFEMFPKVTRGNFNDLMQTQKYIVLAVVEENKLHHISQEMIEFRDMVESVIRSKRDKYHKSFQFGWIGNPELANSIAMSVMPLPHLLVLNSTTNHHHIPEDEPGQLTPEVLDMFLEQIYNQSVPVSTFHYYFIVLCGLKKMVSKYSRKKALIIWQCLIQKGNFEVGFKRKLVHKSARDKPRN